MKKITALTFIIALVMFLAACGSKLTQDNFNKISDGMDYADAVDILGEPQSSKGGVLMRQCIWKNEKYEVEILFRDSKVESKTFSEITAETVKSE